MHTHVALLRGINIGPNKRMKMADLREMFIGLGHDDVATYIASGNVIFDTARSDRRALGTEISAAIDETFGFDVPVIVVPRSELREIIEASPYSSQVSDHKKLIVTLLDETPDPKLVETIDRDVYLPEEFAVIGRAVHIHTPNGQAEMQLSYAFWEKLTGRNATTRNWRTISKLAKMTAPD